MTNLNQYFLTIWVVATVVAMILVFLAGLWVCREREKMNKQIKSWMRDIDNEHERFTRHFKDQ